MTSKVEIRPATKADVLRFYKGPPIYSARAVVAVVDGEPIGIGGVCRMGKQMVVFTDFDVESISRKDLVRAAREVLKIIGRYTTVAAYIDPKSEAAKSFGKHFGFQTTGSADLNGDEVLIRVNHGPS